MKVLSEWGIVGLISAMCFDTTASNTGWLNGCAVNLEELLGRALLWLPCRHHIHELYVKAAFESIFGIDTSPYYKKFSEFKDQWKDIKQNNIEPMRIPNLLQPEKREIVRFCNEQINNFTLILELYSDNCDIKTPGITISSPRRRPCSAWPGVRTS